jgi:hypothetical protein
MPLLDSPGIVYIFTTFLRKFLTTINSNFNDINICLLILPAVLVGSAVMLWTHIRYIHDLNPGRTIESPDSEFSLPSSVSTIKPRVNLF